MLDKKIGIIALILLLFLSLSAVQASDISEDSIDLASQDSIDLTSDDSIDLDSQDFNIGSIEENQLSDNNLIENSNENYDSLMEVSSNEDSLLDDSLNKSNTSNPSKNNKIQTKLSANKVNAYYKEKSNLIIQLKDSNNKTIGNKAIKILFNGKTYCKTTNKLGKITLSLNLKPKRYDVKICFEGDDEYKSSSIFSAIIIKKAPLSIKTANAKSYYHPDTFFKAKVINKVTKNPVEGIMVLFKVYSSKNKYKNYYAITDKKGIATLNKQLKTGFYDVYTYVKDNANKPFISYKNSKNKATLRVMDISEMGCSSIYVHVNENESAIAFRRDSTYAANLYIVVQKWHGRYAVKQYKLAGTYFFHAITTSDGWLIGTGGNDNPKVNKRIENLAGKIVSSNKINSSILKKIRTQERKLGTGHFAIVAPDGRYAVVWRSGYIKGKLKNGEFLDVPNARSLFRHGKYKKFSNNTAKAALKIAATDRFGVNRRNIMVYHYKRTTKDFKTNATVKVYGSNDKGNLIGRHTSRKKDNVYFKKKFISKFKLSGTPNQKHIGTHEFGNIDKLFKAQTKLSVKNITGNLNQSKYFKLTLKDKKTEKVLKNVKVNLRIYTGKTYKNYVVKTDKNGMAKFNAKVLKVGSHKVLISPKNHKYIISGKSTIVIKKVVPKTGTAKINSTSNGDSGSSGSGSIDSGSDGSGSSEYGPIDSGSDSPVDIL